MPVAKQFLPVRLSACAVACAIGARSITIHAPIGFQRSFLPLKVENPFIKTVTMMTVMTAHRNRHKKLLSIMIMTITSFIAAIGIAVPNWGSGWFDIPSPDRPEMPPVEAH